MGKLPSSYMNPNPNPKKKQKQFHNNHQNQQFHGSINGHDEPLVVAQAASDDAYSFNQRGFDNPDNVNGGAGCRNGFNRGGFTTFNIGSFNKAEIGELKKRLVLEMEQIRSLRDRIDSGQFSSTNNSQNPRVRGGKQSKKLSGNKRPAPFGSNKDLKKLSNGAENRTVSLAGMANMEGMMKECRQILTKLMKHKDGWVFNVPVDDVALGLHDYHQIVKRPMDLGTVKSNFSKKLYTTPVEFSDDVRLTFNNALLYNPKHDPVHGMAEQLLLRFEELYKPIQDKIDGIRREFNGVDDVQGGSWNHIPTPERIKMPKASPVVPSAPPRTAPMKKLNRVPSRSQSSASTPSHPPPPPLDPPPPLPAQSPSQSLSPSKSQANAKPPTGGRAATTKLPKPRAKDPDKREMSMEEKHKLGMGLQSLPQEKMPQLVQIIRKRNEQLAQDGDEIELDIEALDTETLWELDRFVTNWKKLVSKTKRQALLVNMNPGNAAAPSTSAADTDVGATVSEKNDSAKKPKKGDDLDEDDVDIDDDMPVTSFPPVEIEKDEAGIGGGGGEHEENGNAGSDSSSSSSSGSDSSSSSDSDSGSSSGSDSDEDEAQS